MGDNTFRQHEYIVKAKQKENGGVSYSIFLVENVSDTVVSIEDVSENKNKAENFCSFLNRNNISPIHLHDVVEDYFYC